MTRLTNLSVSRGTQRIVDAADLTFAPGQVSLLLGPSGCGKTSLLMAISSLGSDVGLDVSGQLDTEQGPIKAFESLERPVCSLVPQNASLYDDLTVEENLSIVETARADNSAINEALIVQLLSGIDLSVATNSLSAGQRQRIAVVRSILSGSRICLMDEPNAGLDPGMTSALISIIKHLCADGIHVMIAAHHPEPFLRIASRTYFLDGGELREIPTKTAAVAEAFEHVGDRISATRAGARFSLPIRSHSHWVSEFFARDFWSHGLSPTNLLYVGAAGALIAFTLGFVTVTRYPFSPLFFDVTIERMTAELGDLFYRFMIPLFVGILIAARSGSLATTDLLQKRLTGATLSLSQLSVPIHTYRQISLVAAMALSGMLLYVFAMIVSLNMLVIAVTLTSELPGPIIRSYVVTDFFLTDTAPESWVWVTAKIVLSGISVAIVSLVFGQRPVFSGEEIRNTGAAAVLVAVLAVITLQSVLILWELWV